MKKLNAINGRGGGEGNSNFLCIFESSTKKKKGFVMADLYVI
jgi:hypothetical protein